MGKTWRISFMGAQRSVSGELSEQVVQVTATPTQASPNSPQVLFEEQLRDGIYRKYVSIPFVATTPLVLRQSRWNRMAWAK
jgi:hypothetical protein